MNGENLVGRTLLNRYEILELIGSGGMATVYKAHCHMLNRDVAIKVLRSSLRSDEAFVKNFYKESQAAASLSHNNIVSVYDVGEEDGISFIVMEYVDGITLKEYIKRNTRLPWQQACDFAIQICQALEQAHAKNIIHRDIKPQNILLTHDKVCKVTDFGIAKAVAAETIVVGGDTLGSVHYISPEQARGGFTDARSDLYSLGVVLYEMLTGELPFNGETAVAVALQHLEKDPPVIKCVSLNIPTELSYVVSKAMAKEQRNRYQTAEEFASDLRAVLAEEVLPSREEENAISDESTKKIDVDKVKQLRSETKQNADKTAQEESIKPEEEKHDDDYDDEFYEDVDEVNSKAKKKKRSEEKKKPKKTKKTKQQKKEDKLATILAFVTIIVFAAAIFGGYTLFQRSKTAAVPDIVNKTLEEAQTALNGTGFTISDKIEYAISDTIEDGRIISQDPEAKERVSGSKEIRVTVSIGATGGDTETPDVTDMTAEKAIEIIVERGLTYELIEEFNDDVKEGIVIRQSPEKGTMVNKNENIKLYVSKGVRTATEPPVVKKNVPNLVGGSIDKAKELLQSAGLSLGSVKQQPSERTKGTVISQTPESGKQISEGGTVSVVISAGSEEKPTDKPETSEATKKPSSEDDSNSGSNNSDNSDNSEKTTKTFTAYIPQDGEDSVSVKITVDGSTVYNKVHPREDKSVNIDITESGTKTVEVFIDGKLTSSKDITF